jgi:hypothetical protein
MAKPINVVIHGDYNDRDINRAIRDLNSLKTQAGVTGGAMGGLGKSTAALGGVMAATFSVAAITDFFGSAVSGALADEAAMKSLAVSLDNVGQGFRTTGVEQFIDGLARASGTADDVLRPALQQIVTVTKDVTTAQSALKLALDVAGGSSKSVAEVSAALSAAYAGNFTAITRLKSGIDANIIASKDMDKITAALSERYAGQASAAAETYQGKLNRVSVAANEAKEKIGYALLNALDDASGAFGGAGGVTQAIDGAADVLSDFITGLGLGVKGINDFIKAANNAVGATDDAGMSLWDMALASARLTPGLGLMVQGVEGVVEAGKAANDMAEAQAAKLDVLSSRYYGVAAAAEAAQIAMDAGKRKKAVDALGDRLTAYARTFDGVSISQTGGNLSTYFDEVAKSATSASGSMAAAAEVTKVKWSEAAASITTSLDGAIVTMKGKGVELGGALADGYQSRLDAFQGIVDKQVGIVKQGQDALAAYSKTVGDTIMGRLDFTTTGADGKPMTPEQIMAAVFGDIANQSAAVGAMGGIITKLPEEFANKLLALPTTFQTQLANFLAAHPEMITQLNADYAALATLTETTLGIPMANAWAKVGDTSAVSMIASAKTTIADEAEAFRKWVRNHLATTITVKVNYDTSGKPSGTEGRALGGPVTGGTPYIVGENGPELFVPGASGTIVPNDVLAGSASRAGGGGGGNTYAINVNAGVGDPRMIGQQVVEYIKRFEASNSASWRAA